MFASISRSRLLAILLTIIATFLTGCASVPMGTKDQDVVAKAFAPPPSEKASLYIYRNSFVGQALSKSLSIDGVIIGKTANKIYFYKEILPGTHTISTESEFGDNSIDFKADGGKIYFARQYIKMGVFIGGSGIEIVTEEEGKKAILECTLAKPL